MCHETLENLEIKEGCMGKNLSLSKREGSPNKLALLYDNGSILYYATLQPNPATFRNIISYQTLTYGGVTAMNV